MTRSEQKRLAIINAAKEEFIQHGFNGANMDRVCAAAEVSKRTLYRHFESKELLFESVLGIIQSSIDEKLQYPFDATQSLKDQLTAITLDEVDILYSTYGIPFTRVIILEFLRQPEMAQQIIAKLYRSKALANWFGEAQNAGAINDMNVEMLANTYSSIFNGMFLWPQIFDVQAKPEGKELEEKAAHLVFVVLKACEK